MQPHPVGYLSRLLPGVVCLSLALLGTSPAQAQDTGSMAPSWAAPVDDVTGKPAHVTPIGQAPVAAATPHAQIASPSPVAGERTATTIPLGTAHTDMVPVAPHVPPPAWSTGKNTSLMKAVNAWAAKSGWRVLWRSSAGGESKDRRLDAPLNFDGTFEMAIQQLFELYKTSPHPYTVDSYPRQMPPLVVITEMN